MLQFVETDIIYSVVKAAFESAEHSDGKEHDLVNALRKGIGMSLIKAGHSIAEKFGIKPPFDVANENFIACKIKEDAARICGVVKYAKEFGIE